MNHIKTTLRPGIWFVGVPIGTARDITLRALDVLASADVLAAEDTRSLRKLMDIHGVPLDGRRIEALHEHSKETQVARLLARATEESVAYASEAGMPLIADPGFELARAARVAGIPVTCAPGPSAVLTALVLGGLPTDAFHFGGFLPATRSARQRALEGLAGIAATLVLYESPKRLGALLSDATDRLGAERPAAVCRELTKRFEDVRRGTLGELAEAYARETPKGEIVVLIGRGETKDVKEKDIDRALQSALSDMTVKDAAAFVAESLELPRRRVYQRALDMARDVKQGDEAE
ncbi:16S rRNA (cytidine(1402)-2'-O)-methyltransferase [Tateyamaria omphalii]|uniref:Ribosomal RNA small subunit methyltransferase I n=1 Tax=Tateyamaria omphalii TaxID=299262 RepID=A0A1P8MZL8_9RHOB|nr:16S rRNA (cytidine(1402)-2'-O)-methyltransferase [Tateyamaria omphalii]APX13511.1 16S rRNA (cytidine(1402)-2'-O)-methyltransferase [Tateyamaria omphalii]